MVPIYQSIASDLFVAVEDNAFILQTSFCLMVIEDFIEGLWVNVALEIRVTDTEEEVEIVRLLAVLVIAFRHDSHYFP